MYIYIYSIYIIIYTHIMHIYIYAHKIVAYTSPQTIIFSMCPYVLPDYIHVKNQSRRGLDSELSLLLQKLKCLAGSRGIAP